MGKKRVWAIALIVSVVLNVFGLVWLVGISGRSDKSASENLFDAAIYNATITFSEIESFLDSIHSEGTPLEDGLYVLVPPFSCSKCVERSLPQLALTGAPYNLMVQTGREEAVLLSKVSSESIWYYSTSDDGNAACYYPDLIFVIIKDGRIADYYLHNTHVPEAMEVFLQKTMNG